MDLTARDCAAAIAQITQDFKNQDWPAYSWTNNMLNSDCTSLMYNDIQEEGNEKMDILKSFNFGPCGDRAKISHLGVAVKNLNGEWVSYDKAKDEIVNVDLVNFGGSNYVYMIPAAIKDIAPGDVVVHNKHIMFVKKVKDDGVVATDVTAGEVKKILPTKSIFGFDFITKIVSLIDLSGMNANEDNPFGNLLPFLLLGDNKGDDALPLALMMMNGGNLDMSNPLMVMALMGDGFSSKNNLLPLMLYGMVNQKK